ncbi:hypothetical protein JW960_28695 [candidate division KSB1 bacterium]|nr:hypothetical protein [candidate division KSB1 bacterium]
MITPYIERIRDWKIREMVAGFILAKSTFEKHSKRKDGEIHISFGTLRLLCDILFHAKEHHHQIFKRIVNAKKKQFEDCNKYTPDSSEINFMNSVGLLFHKMVVTRELTYMLDYYTEDSSGYQETKNSVDRHLQRISTLFKQGILAMIEMLHSENQQKNVHLATYFIENPAICPEQLNMPLEQVLTEVLGKTSVEDAFMESAQYSKESGWFDKSRRLCQSILERNPRHKPAQKLLASLKE